MTFRITRYDTLESALEQVRQGLAWAAVSIQANYTRAMQQAVTGETGNRLPTIGLHLDTTNYVITNTIQKELWLSFNRSMAIASETFGLDSTESAHIPNPISVESVVYGSESPTMVEFMAPGLISMAIFFAAMALTAIQLVLERKDGVFERTLVAGVKTFEFIVSQISTQLLVLAVQVLLSIVTMFYIIDIENKGSVSLVYLITLMQGMVGMALGLVVSAFSHNESEALAMAMASFLPVSIISGVFWPVDSMPSFLKPISKLGPQTLSLDAMRAVISRGWDLSNLVVLLGLIAPFTWFVLLVGFAALGFHLISIR